MSFGARLVLAICFLVVSTASLVIWLTEGSIRKTTSVLFDNLFEEVSTHAVTHTRGFVLRAAPVVESIAQLGGDALALDDSDRLAHQLLAFLIANPGMSWVSYSDENGRFTGAYRTQDGALHVNQSSISDGRTRKTVHDVSVEGEWRLSEVDENSGYDPRTRNFYLRAKELNRTVWLPPYMFYEGVPGITCASPVFDAEHKLRGVVTVDFNLMALSEFIARLSISPHSRVFLYTADGALLAYSNGSAGATDSTSQPSRLRRLDEVRDSLIQSFAKADRRGTVRATDEITFQSFELRDHGDDYLASTTAFRIGQDLVWVIGVIAPKSDFLGEVWRSQRIGLLLAGGVLLFGVFLAVAMARRVSGPVVALIGYMQRVGGGDLDASIQLKGSREFRELSGSLQRMIADLRDRLRLRQSLNIAMQVQQRLLPQSCPQVQGLDIAGHSTYCDETGGDYYDFLAWDEAASNSLLIAVGDVMGHGVAAALIMAGARAVLRDRAEMSGSLSELINRMNRLITADHEGRRFMTMHLSALNTRTGTYRWVCAGHDPALIYDPRTSEFVEFETYNMPLGLDEDAAYEEHSYDGLRPGHIILIGTDGVWETPNQSEELFGKDRLRDAIRAIADRPAAEICEEIVRRVNEFRGDRRPTDDVTFVVIKVLSIDKSG